MTSSAVVAAHHLDGDLGADHVPACHTGNRTLHLRSKTASEATNETAGCSAALARPSPANAVASLLANRIGFRDTSTAKPRRRGWERRQDKAVRQGGVHAAWDRVARYGAQQESHADKHQGKLGSRPVRPILGEHISSHRDGELRVRAQEKHHHNTLGKKALSPFEKAFFPLLLRVRAQEKHHLLNLRLQPGGLTMASIEAQVHLTCAHSQLPATSRHSRGHESLKCAQRERGRGREGAGQRESVGRERGNIQKPNEKCNSAFDLVVFWCYGAGTRTIFPSLCQSWRPLDHVQRIFRTR